MSDFHIAENIANNVCEHCVERIFCDLRKGLASRCCKVVEVANLAEPYILSLERDIKTLKGYCEAKDASLSKREMELRISDKRAYRAQMALSIVNEYLNGKFTIDKSKLPTTTSGELDWYNAFMILAQKTEEV